MDLPVGNSDSITDSCLTKSSPIISLMIFSTASTTRYSIAAIREEAINLVQNRIITLNQPIRILFEYLPAPQWNTIEYELERSDYLLRDRIIDLVGKIAWESD